MSSSASTRWAARQRGYASRAHRTRAAQLTIISEFEDQTFGPTDFTNQLNEFVTLDHGGAVAAAALHLAFGPRLFGLLLAPLAAVCLLRCAPRVGPPLAAVPRDRTAASRAGCAEARTSSTSPTATACCKRESASTASVSASMGPCSRSPPLCVCCVPPPAEADRASGNPRRFPLPPRFMYTVSTEIQEHAGDEPLGLAMHHSLLY